MNSEKVTAEKTLLNERSECLENTPCKIGRLKVITTLFISVVFISAMVVNVGCGDTAGHVQTLKDSTIKIITLDPGHFHAALVQKSMYEGVSPEVHVYAPEGDELKSHLALVETYNSRTDNPTSWKLKVYTGTDFMEKMITEKAGNTVVIAGNNRRKTGYIKKSVDAGFHVLADKPMAITKKDFDTLVSAFESADKNDVLLYDIMTERYEVTSMLQKEIMQIPGIFGNLEKGSPDDPAVIASSVHHFFKYVSGQPLVRPAWYMDTEQEGNGIVDVTTHMVDLIQWKCFPGKILDYKKDIRMNASRTWPTLITLPQFKKITNKEQFPEYLRKDVRNNVLHVYSNGEMNYSVKGVHARVSVVWNYEAPAGTGDTHHSLVKGTKANLVIRQGKEQQFKPVLYIEPKTHNAAFKKDLQDYFVKVQEKYPGVELKESGRGYEVVIPEKYKVGHEAHFAEVTKKFLSYIRDGNLPDWEVPNMLTKYYTTTEALEKSAKE